LATPGDVAGASVSVVKQSGNEFQVNPPEPYSIYTENQQPLNSTEPAVAMDGSGDFVISWTGQVSQQLAPKDTTNIYFRMYSPVGVTAAGTAIQGAVMSDLYGQQQLSFDFTTVPSSTTDTFELALGSFVTAPITFSTDPATLAASIQAALSANPNYAQQALADPNLVPVTVTAASTGNPFNFDVTFNDGGTNEQVLRYVATTTDPCGPRPISHFQHPRLPPTPIRACGS